ncbi:hypothetical protein BBO99_00000577 [Phytophthora kernoviae]|uniref:Uncharacterized protein n=2 Tax=Phytophthora kernoviae TaxID=325452 RepID=A0A3R7G431_9STRA|nr:hypothetical protein G195_001437 [Phytophthora kernoviae 00238/432]KAG2532160.1 hypothetical protein JM16_000486 [Phytophthora kernoviae]KAG2533189.1 hypothetical protein JM18_000567 [Phytophthora kernoviae]RLN26109.1 hypothetical protein BBI17_000616 [Phytophthora kernoviae]RLN85453.1 hypothetical protein BBO99_00000577 [Phytophthora kernoviae]
MLVASLFIPDGELMTRKLEPKAITHMYCYWIDFFNGYVDLARVASALFIILQIVIILDSAYYLRDYILDKMDEADRDDDARHALLGSSLDSTHGDGAKTMW